MHRADCLIHEEKGIFFRLQWMWTLHEHINHWSKDISEVEASHSPLKECTKTANSYAREVSSGKGEKPK